VSWPAKLRRGANPAATAFSALKAYPVQGKMLLQLSSDEKLLRGRVIVGAQHVGLAADLAIFNVTLPLSRGFIHDDRVPFSTARALIATFHYCLPRTRLKQQPIVES
jgi:hypothetical protein